MIKNEEELDMLKRIVRNEPFRVPDGYFDNLSERIMAKIPEPAIEGQPRTSHAILSFVPKHFAAFAAAACAAVVIAISATLAWQRSEGSLAVQQQPNTVATNHHPQTKQEAADAIIDECADYTMMDNDDIYAYVSEN